MFNDDKLHFNTTRNQVADFRLANETIDKKLIEKLDKNDFQIKSKFTKEEDKRWIRKLSIGEIKNLKQKNSERNSPKNVTANLNSMKSNQIEFRNDNLTILKQLANKKETLARKELNLSNSNCDLSNYFDCTLGNLNSTNLTTLNRRQTNRATTSDLIIEVSFSLCIPISEKCDGVFNCPNLADESELVCGKLF